MRIRMLQSAKFWLLCLSYFRLLLHFKICWVIKFDLKASKLFKLQYFDIITSKKFRQVLILGSILLPIKYEQKCRQVEKHKLEVVLRSIYIISFIKMNDFITIIHEKLEWNLNPRGHNIAQNINLLGFVVAKWDLW